MNTIDAAESDTKNSRGSSTCPKPPDGGWGWTVVFCSFAIHFIADGVKYSFSIFYDEFLKEFKESQAKTSVVSSIMFSTYLLVGPAAGYLIERYGCRAIAISGSLCASFGFAMSALVTNVTYLIFTAGFLTGIGLGFMYLTSVVSVSLWFERRRPFAIGVATSGTGIGSLVLAPFTQWIVDLMGWRSAMLIVAGILLNCSVFGSLFRPVEKLGGRRYKTTNLVNDSENVLRRNLVKNTAFVVYAFTEIFMCFGLYVPYIFLENLVADLRIANETETSYLLSIIGISNTVGTIVIGYISSWPRVNKFWMYSFGNTVCGLATALSCLCTTYTLMAVYAAIFGFTSGTFASLFSVILVDIVGLDLLTTALGVSLVFEGLSCLIGPPIVGLIYDYCASYCPGLLLSGSIISLSGLIVLFIPCIQRRRHQGHQRKEEHNRTFRNKITESNSTVSV